MDYKDFIRAYIEIHGVLDIRNAISHGKRIKALRLRIYGNYIMMNSLSEYVGVGIKKVGNACNDGKTGILYYQSRDEIGKIFDWCDVVGGNKCDGYWSRVEDILNE